MNGGRPKSRGLGSFVLVFLWLQPIIGSSPAIAADPPPLVPLVQERTVSVNATANDDTSGDSDSDFDAAEDFGRFVSGVGASASIPSGFTSSSAYQDSTIAGVGILAVGSSGYGMFLGGFSSATAMATSELLVTFALTSASDYTLDGSLDGLDGLASLTLEGPAGPVHERIASFEMLTVNESGILDAGEYTLQVISRTEGGAIGPIQLDGRTAYDITLDLGSSGLGDPGGAVPDGSDVLTGDPLRVAKLPGDLVLLTWGRSCRPRDDTYAVYEGPLGDPVGLLPVTCSTGGQLNHEFAPTFDAAVFLVVPSDGLTEGSYGNTSDGVERLSPPAACRPQLLGDPICP